MQYRGKRKRRTFESFICLKGPVRYIRLVNTRTNSVVILFGERHQLDTTCDPQYCPANETQTISQFLQANFRRLSPSEDKNERPAAEDLIHFFLELPYGQDAANFPESASHIHELGRTFQECFQLQKQKKCVEKYSRIVFHFADIRINLYADLQDCRIKNAKDLDHGQICRLIQIQKYLVLHRRFFGKDEARWSHNMLALIRLMIPVTLDAAEVPHSMQYMYRMQDKRFTFASNRTVQCRQFLYDLREAFKDNSVFLVSRKEGGGKEAKESKAVPADTETELPIQSVDVIVYTKQDSKTGTKFTKLLNVLSTPPNSKPDNELCAALAGSASASASAPPERVFLQVVLNFQIKEQKGSGSEQEQQAQRTFRFKNSIAAVFGSLYNNLDVSWVFPEQGKPITHAETRWQWRYGYFLPPENFADYFLRTSPQTLRQSAFDVLKISRQLAAISRYKEFPGSIHQLFLQLQQTDQKNFFLFQKAKDEAAALFQHLRDEIILFHLFPTEASRLQTIDATIRKIWYSYVIVSFAYLVDVYVLARFFRDFTPKETDLLPFAGIHNAVFYFGERHILNYLQFFLESGYNIKQHLEAEGTPGEEGVQETRKGCIMEMPLELNFDPRA
jgi:hypothetical protein